MNLNDLIGQEITAYDTVTTPARQCKYIVTAAYPYFVKAVRICDNGVPITECFNIGELVVMGIIRAYKAPHKTGYRFVRKGYEGKI